MTPWLLAAVGALALTAILWLLTHRGLLKRSMCVAKGLATDPRLPRPLRWLIVVGLAVKVLPADFGMDEVLLGAAAVWLWVRYRDVVRAIITETA